jgi:hypothetical protein
MYLYPVNPTPPFTAICKHCGQKLYSARDTIFADLEGKAFEDYYCKPCKESGFLEQKTKDGE